MTFHCANCGSQNHQSSDCSKPYNGWRERELKVVPLPLKPETANDGTETNCPAGVESADLGRRDNSAVLASGLSGPLPKHKGFPFLTAATRREMDERQGRMTTGRREEIELPKQAVTRDQVSLPRAVKKQQAKQQAKQESLF